MSTNDDDAPEPRQQPRPDEGGGDAAWQTNAGQTAPYNMFMGMTGQPSDVRSMGDEDLAGTESEEGREMGFFDHLEELRSRIIKALIALILCAIACGVFLKTIMEDIILGPWRDLGLKKSLQNLEMMGQLTLSIQVALISGLILAIPFVLWQFWGFIKPGLYERERKMAGWVTVATIACFLGGVAFAYFVLIPTSLGFTATFTYEGISNEFTISNYFSFVLGLILACGVVFEMPMLSYALARFGVITPTFLRKYRRHAIVVILIISAIVTPTPDPFNQLLLAAPLYGLFELSILVAAVATRQRAAAEVPGEIHERRWHM